MNRISVVIPTYNRVASLKVTLDAFARQSMPNDRFEVVVVSDGSNDGTAEMLSEQTAVLPYRLMPISQANGGPAAARNRGIQAASGEVIVLTDDDMEPLPDFLEAHAKHHENDPRIVVLGPMSPDPERFSKEPAWIAWEHIKLREIYDLFRPGGSNSDGRAGPVHFYSGNASVRREHLLAVGGFDENYRRQEDVELAVRLARDCGVWFLFDFATDATHRPTRTFESWIRIPRAYGQLDAQRVKARTLDWAEVEELAARRNPATRLLANTCAACPFIEPAIIGTLRVAASTSWRLAARGPAVAALSAIYNSVYRGALIREMRRLDMEQGTASAAAIGLGKPNI